MTIPKHCEARFGDLLLLCFLVCVSYQGGVGSYNEARRPKGRVNEYICMYISIYILSTRGKRGRGRKREREKWDWGSESEFNHPTRSSSQCVGTKEGNEIRIVANVFFTPLIYLTCPRWRWAALCFVKLLLACCLIIIITFVSYPTQSWDPRKDPEGSRVDPRH